MWERGFDSFEADRTTTTTPKARTRKRALRALLFLLLLHRRRYFFSLSLLFVVVVIVAVARIAHIESISCTLGRRRIYRAVFRPRAREARTLLSL